MKPVALLALVFTGCAADLDGVSDPPHGADGPTVEPGADAPGGCQVSLEYSPAFPIAGPSSTITVVATVLNAPGTLDYDWHVHFKNVAITPSETSDHKQISFTALEPGPYNVDLAVTGSSTFCPSTSAIVNVGVTGARNRFVRLHIVAPPGKDAVPIDDVIMISGGADSEQPTRAVPPGMRFDRIVSGPNGPLPAYLRFIPNGRPDAIIEAFSDSTGHASVVLDNSMFTVLVVPSIPDAPPRRITNWTAANPFLVTDAGTEVNGQVNDPANAAVAGAKVQLMIDGVPSTVATTDADGRFKLFTATVTGPITVEVVPPESTGLPRLSATSSQFDLGALVAVRYAASLAHKDLAGTRVVRGGVPVGGARVTAVGSLDEAGTVTSGAGAPVPAAGEVRITASTDGSGALPAMRVPAAQLSAVIEVARGDLAVIALDATGDVPGSLDAPAMASIATAVVNADRTALPGAVLDLVPRGALAKAGVPVLHVIVDADSAIRTAIAAGGRYDLRFRDPIGRGASLVVTDRTATAIEPTYQLPPKILLSGGLTYNGQPLANASLQILCDEPPGGATASCTGIERARPIAETVSDATGQFTLAVPDPGTM
jgi:hypothetical protein